tara:strand:- start:285 stop:572 length:288 start_codon:yes stop_codon:yes gene_type:complete
MKVNVMDTKSKYEAMVAEGKAAVVKGIACGPAGSKQKVAKQVCEANGISLEKTVKKVKDYTTMDDAVLANILSMDHVGEDKKAAVQAEVDRRANA